MVSCLIEEPNYPESAFHLFLRWCTPLRVTIITAFYSKQAVDMGKKSVILKPGFPQATPILGFVLLVICTTQMELTNLRMEAGAAGT